VVGSAWGRVRGKCRWEVHRIIIAQMFTVYK
jgi:hypothetical protein